LASNGCVGNHLLDECVKKLTIRLHSLESGQTIKGFVHSLLVQGSQSKRDKGIVSFNNLVIDGPYALDEID